MKTIGLAFLVFAAIFALQISAAEKKARTEDGKDVILHEDGTWSYVGEDHKNAKAPEFYRGKQGAFVIHADPKRWKKSEKAGNGAAEAQFSGVDVYAMVISERLQMPLATLTEAAIANVKKFDADAKIVKQEARTINGQEIMAVIIEAKIQGVALVYYNYFYAGEAGSIQVMTWTGQNLFKEIKPQMEEFLNGFQIVKNPEERK